MSGKHLLMILVLAGAFTYAWAMTTSSTSSTIQTTTTTTAPETTSSTTTTTPAETTSSTTTTTAAETTSSTTTTTAAETTSVSIDDIANAGVYKQTNDGATGIKTAQQTLSDSFVEVAHIVQADSAGNHANVNLTVIFLCCLCLFLFMKN